LSPTLMQAAYILEHGSPAVIRYGPLPVPVPGPTDVLVRVEAVAVNPVDAVLRAVPLTPLPFPFVLGRDLVGEVVHAGDGAPEFRPGDRVWSAGLGHGGRQGSFAEYAVAPKVRLHHLPDDLDPDTVVAAAHPLATAWLALHRRARLRAGETVYVGGAGGNVGSAAVAVAAAAGARVLCSARPEDFDRCRALGADQVFDYRGPTLAGQIRAAAPDGLDVHLETSGHHDLATAVPLLAPRARLVLMSGLRGTPSLPVAALYTRQATITGFSLTATPTTDLATAARHLTALLHRGVWQPRIAGQLPLADTAEAHRRIESGELSGRRLLLRP